MTTALVWVQKHHWEWPGTEVKKVVQPVNLVDRNYLPNLGLTENICWKSRYILSIFVYHNIWFHQLFLSNNNNIIRKYFKSSRYNILLFMYGIVRKYFLSAVTISYSLFSSLAENIFCRRVHNYEWSSVTREKPPSTKTTTLIIQISVFNLVENHAFCQKISDL